MSTDLSIGQGCKCFSLFGKNVLLKALDSLIEDEEKDAERFKRIEGAPEMPAHVEEFRRLNEGVHQRRVDDYKSIRTDIQGIPLCAE